MMSPSGARRRVPLIVPGIRSQVATLNRRWLVALMIKAYAMHANTSLLHRVRLVTATIAIASTAAVTIIRARPYWV